MRRTRLAKLMIRNRLGVFRRPFLGPREGWKWVFPRRQRSNPPVDKLYGWCKPGEQPLGWRSGFTARYRAQAIHRSAAPAALKRRSAGTLRNNPAPAVPRWQWKEERLIGRRWRLNVKSAGSRIQECKASSFFHNGSSGSVTAGAAITSASTGRQPSKLQSNAPRCWGSITQTWRTPSLR